MDELFCPKNLSFVWHNLVFRMSETFLDRRLAFPRFLIFVWWLRFGVAHFSKTCSDFFLLENDFDDHYPRAGFDFQEFVRKVVEMDQLDRQDWYHEQLNYFPVILQIVCVRICPHEGLHPGQWW